MSADRAPTGHAGGTIGLRRRDLGDLGPSRPFGAVRDRIVAYASFEPGPEDRPADSI
jgi:hypothetical protein